MSVQFYECNFGGTCVFHFFAIMHSFQKLVSYFGDFQTLYGGRKSIEKALHAHECVRWMEAFIANLGHPLWGSQSIQDLASIMRKGRTFLIPHANSCIDCEPHKGWPRFAMNASIHLTHSFACRAFSMDFLPPYRVWKSPKYETNFWKECITAKKWKTHVPPKLHP